MPVAAAMCLTDDLIDKLWRNQTKFHSRLSRKQNSIPNRQELSSYNQQIMLMSISANYSVT